MKTVKVKAKSKPKSKTNTKRKPVKRDEYPMTTISFTYPEITKYRNALAKYWIPTPSNKAILDKMKKILINPYLSLKNLFIMLNQVIEINKAVWGKTPNRKIPVEFVKSEVGWIHHHLGQLIIQEENTHKVLMMMKKYDNEAFQTLQTLREKIAKESKIKK